MKARYIQFGLVLLFMALALFLRAGVSYGDVFVADGHVRFLGPDPYHHMRLADNLDANFPIIMSFDPYIGDDVTMQPLLTWLIVLLSRFTGWHIDVVGAWIPAVCGVLLVVPVYFIGRVLFGKWAGILAALVVAILPGEILGRTSLGFTDHHCLEILLSTTAMAFLAYAVKVKEWYIFPCLLFLGLYLLAWQGALLFVAIILVFLWLRLFVKGMWPYALGLLACASFGAAMLFLWMPELWDAGVRYLGLVFSFGGAGGTISEAQTLSMAILWGNFSVCLVLAFAGLAASGAKFAEKRDQGHLMLLVWAVVVIVISIFQRRFAYYLAIDIALLGGLIMGLTIERLAIRKLTWKETKRTGKQYAVHTGYVVLSALIIVSFVVVPCVRASVVSARYHPYMITPAWEETLIWLKENTPEPFSADFYYENYDIAYREHTVEGGRLEGIPLYPNAYRILAWWDYGHWIVRQSHRPVACSPAGGQTVAVAKFLLSLSNEEAEGIAEKLGIGYVIVDYSMVRGKLYAIPFWADVQLTEEQLYTTMLWRLYYGAECSGYRLVFESTREFEGESQVKVFRRY